MSLYIQYNLEVIFLKLDYCVNFYYGTNSDNTALNPKTFINLSRMGDLGLIFIRRSSVISENFRCSVLLTLSLIQVSGFSCSSRIKDLNLHYQVLMDNVLQDQY